MNWNQTAFAYDFFENLINRQVYQKLGPACASLLEGNDCILECACGTGIITKTAAGACRRLFACDLSRNMLQKARQACRKQNNVRFLQADITHLPYADHTFDKVIAGNVLHLLDDPHQALKELCRVCKPGGLLILPLYIEDQSLQTKAAYAALELSGLRFPSRMSIPQARRLFDQHSLPLVREIPLEGFMNCWIPVLKNPGLNLADAPASARKQEQAA